MDNSSLWELEGRKYILTDFGKETLIQDYNLGYSQLKLCKKFNVSEDTIRKWMRENNISTRTRKYTLDENYFENIDSPECAYWVGFLSADGYASRRGELVLELQERDYNHIEKFKKAIKSSAPIQTIKRGNLKQFTHYKLYIRGKKMVTDLSNYNIVSNKSLTFIPKNIPEDLFKYWIIGYMDGDGCVYIAKNRIKITFTGTYETLSIIKNFFQSSNKIRREHRCENNTYAFTLEVAKSEHFLSEINYKNLPFALERKKSVIAPFIQ